MSGDDSFFGPSRTSQPAQLHLRSRHAPDTPGESDADTTADATFFGAPRHRHPVVHDLSTMEQVRTLERAQADIDERQAYLDTTDLAAEAAALHALTPATRAQVEAYRQQVRQEARAEARADFASSVGESFIEGNYEGEEYDEDEDEDEEEGDVEIAEADDSYESEGSSDIFDPDNDPVGFAERLDELAGVMEMGEVEARALRWGPSMGGSHGECLCLAGSTSCPRTSCGAGDAIGLPEVA